MSDLKKLVNVKNWRLPQTSMLGFMFIVLVSAIICGPTTITTSVTLAIVGTLAYTFLMAVGGFYNDIKLPQIVTIIILVTNIMDAAIHNGQACQVCPLQAITYAIIDLFILVEGGFFA